MLSYGQTKKDSGITGVPVVSFFLRWYYPDQVMGVYSQAVLQTTSSWKLLICVLKISCQLQTSNVKAEMPEVLGSAGRRFPGHTFCIVKLLTYVDETPNKSPHRPKGTAPDYTSAWVNYF